MGRLESIHTADQKLSIPITLSFLGHVVFCVLFIMLPKITLEGSSPTHIINVQLVTRRVPMPASVPMPEQTMPLPEATPVAQPEPVPTPEASVSTASKPTEAVSLASEKEEIETKRSMKKKTYKRERLLESAIKSVEKRVEASKSDSKKQALNRIQSELNEKETQTTVQGNTGAEARTSGMSGEGSPISDIQRVYYAEVAFSIQRNWVFSDQLAGDEKNLYNEVGFKIMRNGEIKDIWFDRRSGNSYLDESARKAILKSSPLPPIPDEMKGAFIELGARFTPEGIN